ncbi:MAG: hypothetical protein WCQ41_10255 [Bacillota bacterium]
MKSLTYTNNEHQLDLTTKAKCHKECHERIELKDISKLKYEITRFWLDSNGVKKYSIDKDGKVDVKGDVKLRLGDATQLRVNFGIVEGDFDCTGNKLTCLIGAPDFVGGSFMCCDNELTNLIGASALVCGNFICCNNSLTSLEYGPVRVCGDFSCINNPLKKKYRKEALIDKIDVTVEGEIIYDKNPDYAVCHAYDKAIIAKEAVATAFDNGYCI